LARGKLRKRWDNAPHHKEVETFPYHIHIGRKVSPHESVDIFNAHLLESVQRFM